MLKQITVPNIGDFKNVEVIEVSVKPGDHIKKDQSLITLETDKAAMEIPSTEEGVVKELMIALGSKVSTGDVILTVELAGENQASAEPPKAAEPEKLQASTAPVAVPSAPPVQAPVAAAAAPVSSGSVHAGPATRRLAYELGIDLSQVKGTGQKGRVVKTDIHEYVKARLANPSSGTGLGVEPMPEIDFSKWGEVETQPVKRIQKLSAKFLHRNWVTIPHVTHFDEADITELEAFRQETNLQAEKIGVKLTPLVFLMKSVVCALKTYPQFNTSLTPDGQNLIFKKYFHIGVAVDTPDGLVVPVVRDVEQKGIYDLAKELGEMSAKARAGKLTSGDMQGGCFTLSSLGGIGGTNFTPIINAPEVAILGISKSVLKPVYKNGVIEPRLMLPLSLSYDHRVIDGAQAARFLASISAQLSDIRMLLL